MKLLLRVLSNAVSTQCPQYYLFSSSYAMPQDRNCLQLLSQENLQSHLETRIFSPRWKLCNLTHYLHLVSFQEAQNQILWSIKNWLSEVYWGINYNKSHPFVYISISFGKCIALKPQPHSRYKTGQLSFNVPLCPFLHPQPLATTGFCLIQSFASSWMSYKWSHAVWSLLSLTLFT